MTPSLKGATRKTGLRSKANRVKRHVTIREVAKAAGASVSTISAALNNSDYVSADMRSRIDEAIKTLRYFPNDLARGLRLQKTHSIAIVVPDLSNNFYIELVRGATGLIYGRRTYEIMRYWDEDLPDWDAEDREFAVAWRNQPKWVVSRSLKSVGPNSTLVADDFEKVIRRLKAELAGEIQVAGPVLAQSLTEAGLIDEYRLYLRPVVFGGGQPFFAGPRPPLHLVASDLIADDLIRLTYVPA